MIKFKKIQLNRKVLTMVVAAILGSLILSMGFPQIQLGITGGYEGGKMYFYGIKTQNPYNGLPVPKTIIWNLGESFPSYADTWQFNHGRFNLDPYGTNDYWQNLIGVSDGSGVFERNAFGNIRTDTVQFTERVSETDTEITDRVIEANVFYSEIDLTLKTDVDESFPRTEKDDPWRATELILNVQSNDYYGLPSANGDENNWSTLLGVEVVRWEKISGDGDVVMMDFQGGQMLPMYDSWSDFEIDKEFPSQSGDSFLSEITYFNLNGASIPIVQSALVSLGFSAFGTEPSSTWGSWEEPQLHITIRLHILKVGSWIVVQEVGEPYKPPIDERPKGDGIFPDFQGMFNTLAIVMVLGSVSVVGYLLLVNRKK